jgi:hypothetical protein
MEANQRASIVSPLIDPILVGGLSLATLTTFLILRAHLSPELLVGNFIVLTVLLNGAHFMASYALLYSSWEYVRRYRTAAIYLPLALLATGATGLHLAAAPYNEKLIVQGIIITTALYLALHYTGQAWGMMASFSFLRGIKFSSSERSRLRLCLRTMAGWHMGWALWTAPAYVPTFLAPVIPTMMVVLNVLALTSFGIGVVTLCSLQKRLGTLLPLSIALPFISIYVWYLFLWIFPQSIFWVQIFHALQYLAFPARVQVNKSLALPSPSRRRHLFRYAVTLAGTSLLVFVGIDKALNYPSGGFETHWLVLCSLINIHHYFIDGCIWHISNPEVRAQLFAHVAK